MKKLLRFGSVAVMAVAGIVVLSEIKTTDSSYISRGERKALNVKSDDPKMGGDAIFKELRKNVVTGEYDAQEIMRVSAEVKKALYKRSGLNLNWQEMGPSNIGGRTRAILIDKNNVNRVYAGGVSGGIFISDNKGGNWRPYDDLMENLMISYMAQSKDGDIIYVATGSGPHEGSAGMPGGGIFKSTNNGESFELIPSTIPSASGGGLDFTHVLRIVCDPNDNNTVYAGTWRGVYYSTDAGQTWTKTMYQDPNCTILANGRVDDLEITSTGKLIVGYNGGVWYSSTPKDGCSYERASGTIAQNSGRIDISFCESNEDIVYAIQVTGAGFLSGVFSSNDGGVTFDNLDPGPPTAVVDSTFRLFGDNGQGVYDLAIKVFPSDCDRVLIGGVQFYRVAGAWARVAEMFAFEFSGVYVHADIHYFTFEPGNDNTLYIGNDGGIGKSDNALSNRMTFYSADRGYNVTQFWDIDVSPEGQLLGGTQDNGSLVIDPSSPGSSSMNAFSVQGGDGFGTRASWIMRGAFVTLYYNAITRLSENGSGTPIVPMQYSGEGIAPFNTELALWETVNDPTSKDSVTFLNDTTELVLARGNGNLRIFNGTFLPSQSSAEIISGSVSITNRFASTTQIASDVIGDGILRNANNDSIGTYNYTTGQYSVRFEFPPADQSDVIGKLATRFASGDTLTLLSATNQYRFTYVLPIALNNGDSIMVQDPVQSLLASSVFNGPIITREALLDNASPEWFDLRPVQAVGTPLAMEFSPDGNHLYVGSSQGVWRYSGLNDLYNGVDPVDVITATRIFNATGGRTVGIRLYPNDHNKMIVTQDGYGHSNHVFRLNNVQTTMGAAQAKNISGDLPSFPVYTAEIDQENPNIVLIGTDFGVWSCQDVEAPSVEWANENATLSNTPIFRLVQQRLPWNIASNYQRIYAGTHGRGIWATGDLINYVPKYPTSADRKVDLGLSVYPNPVTTSDLAVKFKLGKAEAVDFTVFDLNGRIVKAIPGRNFSAGENEFRIDTSRMPGGTYFIAVKGASEYSTAKFVIVR
jgi:hypothetical protein